MEEGLRFRGSEKGASGEKVIWCPRGMNGELGGGTMSYGRICLKCGGESYSSTPAYRLLGLGLRKEGWG